MAHNRSLDDCLGVGQNAASPKIPKHLIGDGGANVIQERDAEAEPNPEVCHLRSYDEEEISCHEKPVSRPPAKRGGHRVSQGGREMGFS